MKNSIIFILFILGISNNIFAYPISPRPLRKLVIESRYIIVGYVTKTYDLKKDDDNWNNKIAKIAILENLQGNIQRDTIEIEFSSFISCPAPAIYFNDTFVISFVNYDKKNKKFYTHALSYGSKTLKKEDIEIYKQRILEIQNILKISNKKKQITETIEWLVKCAENETTRWEGTFELSPESNFMSFYSRDKKDSFKEFLNDNQKERLRIALLKENEYVDFSLVDLVYKGNEILIDQFLLEKLKALKEEEYWFADEFIKRLKHKNSSSEMKKNLDDYEKLSNDYSKIEELKIVVKKIIELLDK